MDSKNKAVYNIGCGSKGHRVRFSGPEELGGVARSPFHGGGSLSSSESMVDDEGSLQ